MCYVLQTRRGLNARSFALGSAAKTRYNDDYAPDKPFLEELVSVPWPRGMERLRSRARRRLARSVLNGLSAHGRSQRKHSSFSQVLSISLFEHSESVRTPISIHFPLRTIRKISYKDLCYTMTTSFSRRPRATAGEGARRGGSGGGGPPEQPGAVLLRHAHARAPQSTACGQY